MPKLYHNLHSQGSKQAKVWIKEVYQHLNSQIEKILFLQMKVCSVNMVKDALTVHIFLRRIQAVFSNKIIRVSSD